MSGDSAVARGHVILSICKSIYIPTACLFVTCASLTSFIYVYYYGLLSDLPDTAYLSVVNLVLSVPGSSAPSLLGCHRTIVSPITSINFFTSMSSKSSADRGDLPSAAPVSRGLSVTSLVRSE